MSEIRDLVMQARVQGLIEARTEILKLRAKCGETAAGQTVAMAYDYAAEAIQSLIEASK